MVTLNYPLVNRIGKNVIRSRFIADVLFMKKHIIILFFLMLSQLSASTVLVNSLYNGSDNNDENYRALEDGLMDSLFDMGLIMFSTVNAPDSTFEESGAEFLIDIEILDENFTVSYTMISSIEGEFIQSGTADLAQIKHDPLLDEEKLYYLLGVKVARILEQFF